MNTIAAIVVTHNNEDTITKCVHSLQQAGIIHIVVVDNASTDDTVETLRQLSVHMIQNQKNTGFGAGINQAAKEICKDPSGLPTYLLFLNPDAILEDPLKDATKVFEENAKIGVVGLSLRDENGLREAYAQGYEPTLLSLITRAYINPLKGSHAPNWVSGGAMLVRREVFEGRKGFDEQFFLYWEDVDFCRRVRGAGFQIVTAPNIRVRHLRGASLSDKATKTRIYDESADKYFKKHYAWSICLLQRFLRRLYRLVSPYSQ